MIGRVTHATRTDDSITLYMCVDDDQDKRYMLIFEPGEAIDATTITTELKKVVAKDDAIKANLASSRELAEHTDSVTGKVIKPAVEFDLG